MKNVNQIAVALVVVLSSSSAFAQQNWNTDTSDGFYIHRGISANMCKMFAEETLNTMYDDESNEFYGYMHRNHPLGEGEEQSTYGFSRVVDLDTKTSYGCEMIYVSHDVTNEGDYKSRIQYAVSEPAYGPTVIYIENTVPFSK